MHHSRFVSMVQSKSRLSDVFGRIEKAAGAVFLHQLLQAVALDILHDEEVDLVLAVGLMIDIVGPDDVGMIERRDGLGFTMEASEVRRVMDTLGGQYLQRTATTHQRVLGQINRTHAPFAEQRQQPVLPQEVALVLALQ